MIKQMIKRRVPKSTWDILVTKKASAKKQLVIEKTEIRNFLRKRENQLNRNFGRDEEIIVSLTTYPARFKRIHLVVESIINQTMKPDRIIINLAESEIKEKLPRNIKRLQKYGVEICIRDDNLKPHNKYYFTMEDNPEATIITVDDDFIYDKNLIEELYYTHIRFPNTVVACRGHKIGFKNEEPMKYNNWEFEIDNPYSPSMQILATGVGGVLYPPKSLHSDLFRKELIREMALKQDDLWLKIMELKQGTKVVLCTTNVWKNSMILEREQELGLAHANVDNNENDYGWHKLLSYYKLKESDFK